jgi:hypothetical protein
MTMVIAAWTLLTLGGAAYGYWSVQHSAACFDAQGTGPFCRYQAFSSALQASLGPLALYAAGTILLGVAWLWTMPDLPPCPKCGSLSRSDRGVCARCRYDPYQPDEPPPPRPTSVRP